MNLNILKIILINYWSHKHLNFLQRTHYRYHDLLCKVAGQKAQPFYHAHFCQIAESILIIILRIEIKLKSYQKVWHGIAFDIVCDIDITFNNICKYCELALLYSQYLTNMIWSENSLQIIYFLILIIRIHLMYFNADYTEEW